MARRFENSTHGKWARRDILKGFTILGGACLVAPWLPARAADSPVKGGSLVMSLQTEPVGLVQGITTSSATSSVSPHLFDGLVVVRKDGSLEPCLATSWEVTDAGKTVTFKLREGVRWHDGTPLTSADVQFSIMGIAKKVHPRGTATLASVIAVDTPDPLTAVLRFSSPAPVIWRALYGNETMILPRHIYDTGKDDLFANPANIRPVGTGPFRFKEWVKGSHLVLERNPDYWHPAEPHLDSLIFKFIKDPAARTAALKTGEISYAPNNPISLQEVRAFQANPEFTVDFEAYRDAATLYFFDFNLRKPLFQDHRVREAIALSIDRNLLSRTAWAGLATPATGPIPAYQKSNYNPHTVQYPFDPKRAEALLDEAGHPRGPGGIRFTIDHLPNPYGEPDRRSALFFKQALKAVGIELEVKNFDTPTYLRKAFTDYDFDTHSAWYSSFLDPQIGVIRRFWSQSIKPGTPAANASGFADAEMDAVIDRIIHEGDEVKRHEAILEMQALAQQKLPSINLLELPMFRVYSNRLHDLPPSALQSFGPSWLQS
ncbi:putative ABC transporter peptide-binding protein [Pseudomonas reidholzensis]|uniref:Putative ABC transporter peptide-binding protein n=1 Tax=Pseudomonas reidholzensis TaxID=1785162 RepID=A0A383RYR9_9PSED|nr:ABC transporter substrate-binding protein [Pseudomonas reidholzensis]SYX91784.1 putative ABC transporter peptide-binding protein [Pseudomonas reidholzensis]